MSEYVLVGSNYHHSGVGSYKTEYTKKNNVNSFPEKVTLGFRNSFWHVFSSLKEYKNEPLLFEWLGKKWEFVAFWTSESKGLEVSSYLEDPNNIFWVVILKQVNFEDDLDLKKLIFRCNLNEQSAISNLIDCLDGTSLYSFMKSFEHNRKLNALFTWLPPKTEASIPSLVTMFSFYSYCKLLLWKIGRDQTNIKISLNNKDYTEELKTVLKIQGIIINVKRYFLTKNISNDEEIKLLAKSIKKHYAIRAMLEGFLPLNESIEKHLKTASQIKSNSKGTVLNFIAFFIALVGIPVSLMSMLLTITRESEVLYGEPGILIDSNLLSFFAMTTLASILPFSIISICMYSWLIKKIKV